MEKNWEVLQKKADEGVIDLLLKHRGVKTLKQRREFFNPTHPLKISTSQVGISEKEIKKAVKGIKKAISKKQKIIVYGDYDADGITASAILWEALYEFEADVVPYIPDRFEEGYGIGSIQITNLKSQYKNLGLIITVDTGIVAFEAADKARELGVDLIITDHHEPEDRNPEALAVIHSTQISGSAVSWFLAREFVSNSKAEDLLSLAALGTVADQLPLRKENRSIVKYGLESLRKTQRPGILALCAVAAVDPTEIDVYGINFVLAPRLNAMGRLEHAIDSLRLLCTKNQSQAYSQAELLEKTNLKRREIVEQALTHAYAIAKEQKLHSIIVVGHEQYHEGVIGLIASKLSETYSLPAIVFSKGEKISKASGRSISGFNLIQNVRKLDKYLISGGGHEMAAGFSVETKDVEQFSFEMQKLAASQITSTMKQKKITIDLELAFSDLSFEIAQDLERFEPTGIGNFKPIFVTRNVTLISFKKVGDEGKHLKLEFKHDGREYGAIAFGLGPSSDNLIENQKLDIAYNFEINRWKGYENLQLKIRDLRPSSV